MCTRCVRFTREISGTAELAVMGRGDHEEIDVFPGRPLENKLAGNVVDLCPVGALGSKDFLYKQRVWYLKTTDGVCSRCSTGCSVHVDTNKEIVFRLRPRMNEKAEAKGYWMCDEGRYGYHFANSGERFLRPMVKAEGRFKPAAWTQVSALLKQERAAVEKWTVVLSPFLTVEEAFLLAKAFRGARLVLGPIPIIGEDDRYPKDVHGNAVEPTKFTIRAEKCPNRVGVEKVIRMFQDRVFAFSDVVREPIPAMWFAGGYPVKEHLEAAFPSDWKAPQTLIAQDLFPTLLTASAKIVLPATASFEKDGTFVNHAELVQTFPRATLPPVEVRTELQIGHDLLARRGLVQANAVRKEMVESGLRMEGF